MDTITLTVEQRPGAEAEELDQVGRQVLNEVGRFLGYYPTDADPRDASVEVAGNTIRFVYPAGPNQARLTAWLRAGLVGAKKEIEAALSEAGVGWVEAPRSMSRALAPSADLDCPVLEMLRPSESFERAMVGTLSSSKPEERHSAAWYLGNMGAPSAEAVRELIRRGDEPDPGVRGKIHRALQKLSYSVELIEQVREHHSDQNLGVRAAALAAVEGLVDRGRLDPEEAFGWMLEAVHLGAPATDIAAEKLTRLPNMQQHRSTIVQSFKRC